MCSIANRLMTVFLVACVLRATTKIGRQLFLRTKVHLVTWYEGFLTSI